MTNMVSAHRKHTTWLIKIIRSWGAEGSLEGAGQQHFKRGGWGVGRRQRGRSLKSSHCPCCYGDSVPPGSLTLMQKAKPSCHLLAVRVAAEAAWLRRLTRWHTGAAGWLRWKGGSHIAGRLSWREKRPRSLTGF